MEQLRSAVLATATLLVGLSAGVFFAYSTSVMLALRRVDDRTFVDVMQKINAAILNGWFLTAYVGALLAAIAAVLLHLGGTHRPMLPWLIAATVLYLVVFVATAAVNVPLNNQLDAAGPVASIPDPATVRAAFEDTWNRWNTVRTLSSAGALLCLAVALLRH
ncbi:anthrone oxygenase family protein [Dactylosporangium sp. NPDC005555]|uniref:anthrone oxygenase family protein n=1 Tax=Dactylosporangium sp. NPDC005555 TaxID=3154889 RepID=UPI0033AD379A